jgi:carboxyl-terminal processing protease
VAIVRIPTFTAETAAALRQAAEEASHRSITRMIVDLRGTIGGEIADAAPAAALFTGKGTVAKVVSRRAVIAPLEAATERIWKGRTVILTDDATGGPSEVFAAAVHDRADGTTVGETTVGMAIVQRPVPTEAGGILYMTVGRYVSPSGAVLGGRGLSPDERVLVFPGESDAKDPILTRGLEVVRGASLSRHAA